MMNGRHAAREPDRTNEFPKLEDQYGEDPARWLESNELMATGRIGGIRDPELLEAYHAVAKQITAGQFRESVLEAIAERKSDLGLTDDELTGEPISPETSTTDPVAATDGGERLADSRSSSEVPSDVGTTADPDSLGISDISTPNPEPSADGEAATSSASASVSASDSTDAGTIENPENSANISHTVETTAGSGAGNGGTSPASDSASDSDQLHPDVKGLEPGQILVVEHPDTTEYIFPATPAADAPYLMHTGDADATSGLSFTKVLNRLGGSTDPTPVSELDLQAPKLAATNGGGSE